MSNLLLLTDDNFQPEVLESETPVMVDFSATWCGPCKQLMPIVEQIATDYSEKLKVGKVDVDEARETAMRYGIMSVPTILFFRNGEVADQLVGAASRASLDQRIQRLLA